MKLIGESHTSSRIPHKSPKSIVGLDGLVFFGSCSEYPHVSFSVTEVHFLTFLLIQIFVYFFPLRLVQMEGVMDLI